MRPSVSVIVVSWNTRELLRECLRAVLDDDYAGAVELIVVDNGSLDGSPALVRDEFPQARLIANTDNVGFARANNQALAVATGELLFLVNSDAFLRPGCITALVDALQRDRRVGIVGPALRNRDGSRQPSWGVFPTPQLELLLQSYLFKVIPCPFPAGQRVHPRLLPDYEHFHAVDWVSGAALMLTRRVLDAVGGMPEHTFMYGEDLELCALAKRAGHACAYEPAAEAVHLLGASSHKDYERWIDNYNEAALGYFARFESEPTRRAHAAALLAGNAFRTLAWQALGLVRAERRAEVASRTRGYGKAVKRAAKTLLDPS